MEEKRPGEFVEVAPGQSGELWVSGATVFDRYDVPWFQNVVTACTAAEFL